jgi:hypothetical protein
MNPYECQEPKRCPDCDEYMEQKYSILDPRGYWECTNEECPSKESDGQE